MLGNDCATLSSGVLDCGSPAICGFIGFFEIALLVARREVTDVRSYACVDARFGMTLECGALQEATPVSVVGI